MLEWHNRRTALWS